MIEIRRILCPIDFSEFSGRALDHAVAIARWYGSRVTVLHVFRSPSPVDIIPSLNLEPAAHGYLTRASHGALADHLRQFVEPYQGAGVTIDVALQEAPDVHREILAQASVLNADLMIIGSHGRSGFERLLLGSVTEKLLRKATCPVMVIPHQEDPHQAGTATFSRILCPVDFSESSVTALAYAMSLAEEANAHLTVVNVIEVPPELHQPPTSPDFDVAEVRAAAEAESLRRLRALIPEQVHEYCTVETATAEGRASHQILRLACAQKSDLIVMGVQGRGAVDLMVFGSNTQQVIRAASCPVLVIHRG